MNTGLFWRALAVQALAVTALALVLLALPLGDDFFEDYGFAAGPLAWLVASLVTARVLSLPPVLALFSAAAGGVAGTIVMLVTSHWPGLVAGLLVFAASCAAADREAAETASPSQAP